ncbi:helix-turn-helix transcriptional regulator [Paenibacillus sp. 481]|uniref:helix-turn-helix transcriptional regulator n=1 Tax=Paenibacillus sp. 481 TaxID=2835869 RepID=UPI001E2D51E0|nr:helix-turn-helix transcriptional regulator [Paenibacillus sp. 481]UHA74560.1 helix-turn-helix transcriptional regulator [Paenibacillus sp. 481]
MNRCRKWLIHYRGSMTQKEVAALSMIERSSYSNIERGRRDPSVQVAKRIGQVLGCDWKLFYEDINPIMGTEEKAMLIGSKHSHN